jgi:hypothetical protein
MKKLIFLMIVPALICEMALMTGCEKNEKDLGIPDGIIGFWAHPKSEIAIFPTAIYCYKRVKTLPINSEGIRFLKDGTLIERNNKNAGWSPPITYDDFSGTWRIENGNDIKISVAFWGGTKHQTWKIIDVTNKILRIEMIPSDTEYDFTEYD